MQQIIQGIYPDDAQNKYSDWWKYLTFQRKEISLCFFNSKIMYIKQGIIKGYFLPDVEIKDCNLITDGRNFYINVKNDIRISKNTRKLIVGKEDNYRTFF